MKRLLVYLKDYRKESILGPLFKLLEASFELLVPLVMAAIIDKGIANRDTGYVIRMCLVMVALGIIGLICSVTAQYFAAKAAVGFATGVRHALFSHIQKLSYTEIDTLGTSTMMTRMTSDVNQAQSGVNMTLRLFLRSPFIVFGAMIMAFTINVRAAMIFVVTIPLLSIVVFGIMLITMPLYKKVQAGLDKVLGTTRENLTGVRVLRAFNKEEEERERFSERNESLTKMQIFAGRISALMNPITYVIINGAVAVLIWTGAIQVDSGIITQGEVVALVNYMSQILVELIKLANLIITITKALACAGRIAAVLETEPDMTASAPEEWKADQDTGLRGTVEFSHASLIYKNAGAESLTDVNFRAERGQTIGVIGGTGSGKTSLINLIPRFYDVSDGAVLVDGVNVKDYPFEVLREKIGVVPQKAVLFKGTIAENLRWGKKDADEKEMWEALELSQAKEFVEKKEGGLDWSVAQGGRNLSGGQRQRLTIARALVKKPEILILDDSASALDFATDARLRKAIRGMKEKLTVFIVSQRASSIQYADQIVVLDDGAVVGIGTHEKLLESCGVYQEIYYSQFPKEVE
ncbi:ABC transporter ATP-binding protein [Fusibacillus kribbianus]|uniref:ABC transporter ATP-binding protein n=1 Tax=Fusibacillus kribbianus TaxID=3044208 RepID=A0AAP4EY44_9FIRM|nr:ABC transporter ATP-binding protein [Ruminococcus sp. YH-rum2234]MDI9242532.1 ABC transporter ATP-binding protein [Ruminococcus sp. YH-rum2234]